MKALAKAVLNLLPTPAHPGIAGPGLHLRWRIGWLRGWAYRPFWNLRSRFGGPRVLIGKRFSLQGKLKFGGSGTIVFGDDVIVDAVTTPFTHGRKAVIRVGSRCFVNGTRFGCSQSITIGDDCILADARIMDTDFHALHRERNLPGAVAAEKPVRIGSNVWLAAGTAILKGVTIGDDSVIAFGSVVTKSVPSGRIWGGNPAQDIATVPDAPRPAALRIQEKATS